MTCEFFNGQFVFNFEQTNSLRLVISRSTVFERLKSVLVCNVINKPLQVCSKTNIVRFSRSFFINV